jgi:uncharacterized membrane protein YqaE (UPF0057 family)
MRRLLAIMFPPLAVLSCYRPFSAVFNCFLTLLFWLPGVIHAWAVVDDFYNNTYNKRLVKSIDGLRQPLLAVAASNTVPRARRAKALLEPRPEPVDDPYVGVDGKVFRRRR